jgi:hypothetical protein
MRQDLLRLERNGTYPALARWAERWQVKFQGTGGYAECLRQAWAAVEAREATRKGAGA